MSFFEIVKLIFPLLLICGMLYGLLVFVKRYSFKRGGNTLLDIKVINNQMIMPKKFLSVVKVKDKLLILGVSENNISLLKEIDADETDIINDSANLPSQNFADVFKKFLPR
ncbi:MAG: flagellar biosynthetic protein FliO [Ignavibacteriales bacterium]|nr:flagellar biosynthetic protein FliO [Ignavibacteriales bacterium]